MDRILLLKKSAEISNSCIPLIKKLLKKKISEIELAKEIEKNIITKGAKPAFEIIVASGKRSSKIHAKPTKRIINGIGFIDFGASYKGYKSDLTIPFIKGKISKEEEKIINATIEAYTIAKKEIKVNKNCWEVYEKVNDFLKSKGFFLKHSLGHGVGIRIHQLPIIGKPMKKLKKKEIEKLKKLKFKENMVFTIEPGVYVKGIGGCRIENTFLLKKDKLVKLTNAKLLKIK
ncbi:MAG: M24 family metallopeptidase [Candidatus Micrarchaeia archaeon]